MSDQTKSWKSKTGYIWAMIGSAVGFANILGFGAKCYKNGGGAFLIPLGIAIVALGVPMLILEGVVGKQFKKPLVSAYGQIMGTWGRFLAWPTVLGVLTIGGYYCILNAWTLLYMFFAGIGAIPEDTATFFNENILMGGTSSAIDFHNFSWPVGVMSILLLIGAYHICVRHVSDGIEKLCKIFLPLLFVILLSLLAATLYLPGAGVGMMHFLYPDFDQLANHEIWVSSFGHVFFSLSVGLAIISGYSQYTSNDVDIVRSMIWVAVGDIVTSVISGLVIFGALGYMAQHSDQPFAEVVSSSVFGLGFVVFPQILNTFPELVSKIVGVLFFFSLFIAGFSGLVSIAEAVIGNFVSEFSWTRKKATQVSLGIMAFLAFCFSFANGASLVSVIDEMTAGANVLISGILQILCFLYFSKEIQNCDEWQTSKKKKAFHFFSLKYLSLGLLIMILFGQLGGEMMKVGTEEVTIRWIWFAAVLLASGILTYLKTRRDSGNQR